MTPTSRHAAPAPSSADIEAERQKLIRALETVAQLGETTELRRIAMQRYLDMTERAGQ